MISNSIIRDETISLKAKGLYALIQSYITLDSFVLYKDFLVTKCKEGKAAFDSAWKELKETGYLKQYKMNSENGFYYEYELLDSPDIDFPDVGNPEMESPGMGSPEVGNGGYINNTIHNNTLNNNTNQIISIDDVMDQIGAETFETNKAQVKEIATLITDVMNAPDNSTVRIARNNIPSPDVKRRFHQLNQFHVEYVLDSLRQTDTKISNMKNYLITTLYNAPTTMNSYYQNKMNSYSGGQ